MKYKGIEFKRAPHLTYRDPLPGEKDGYGRVIKSNYTVFIRVKDCIDAEGKFCQTLRANAPMQGLQTASRTNMMYTESWKKREGARYIRVRRDGIGDTPATTETVLYNTYWTSPVYCALKGRIYAGTMYRAEKPAPRIEASS